MLLRLSFKNLIYKPVRSLGTILIIALAVAFLFCMFSFKEAVYEYIYAVETADAGDSDILIAKTSDGDRITSTSGLEDVEGVDRVVPTLSLYALLNGEYIKLRGFDNTDFDALHNFDIIYGNAEDLQKNSDNVAVSKTTAEHFSLSVGDLFTVSLGGNNAAFYIAAICDDTGYFLNSEPYTVIGSCRGGVARLIVGAGYAVYNEIYIKAAENADVDQLILNLSKMEVCENMLVEPSKDDGYISTQADSMTAPVVISGLGIVVLAVVSIVLIFLMSVNDKREYISKMTVNGATRKQLLGIFLIETSILAFAGAVLGSLVASGVFVLILKTTLSSTITFSVSALKLFAAAALGVVLAVCSGIAPLLLSFRSTARENELSIDKKPLSSYSLPIIVIVTAIITFTVEICVDSAKGILSLINVLLFLCATGLSVPYIIHVVALIVKKSSITTVSIAANNIATDRRSGRVASMLTVGMTVTMMLFMSYSLTTTIFTSYLIDFEDMVLVTNVPSSIAESPDADGIASVEGIKSATPMVWKQGKIDVVENGKTINILGSKDALKVLDFAYITDKSTVVEALNSDENCVILDIAMQKLYGVQVGDTINLTIDNKTQPLKVAGIVSHRLFSGNYAIISLSTLDNAFGIGADTVLVVANDDTSLVAERVRSVYAEKNYYAVEALTAYKWDADSLNAVFDLVGNFAIMMAVLVFLVLISGALVAHGNSSRTHSTLLAAGMSKRRLLLSETTEYVLIAAVSFALSFEVSFALTYSLIGALRLFGLYFEFMYRAWVVAAVGGGMMVAYSVLPLILGFKRSYNMKRT